MGSQDFLLVLNSVHDHLPEKPPHGADQGMLLTLEDSVSKYCKGHMRGGPTGAAGNACQSSGSQSWVPIWNQLGRKVQILGWGAQLAERFCSMHTVLGLVPSTMGTG